MTRNTREPMIYESNELIDLAVNENHSILNFRQARVLLDTRYGKTNETVCLVATQRANGQVYLFFVMDNYSNTEIPIVDQKGVVNPQVLKLELL